MTRPVVVLSHCLADEACRYDGDAIRDPVVRAMAEHVTFQPICPEVAIGLGVPRDPIRLVAARRGVTLVQPASGLDLTERMRRFAAGYLDALGPVDGFLLKGRSPSCGISRVKVHSADGRRFERTGRGLFAAAVLDRHPHAAVETEDRLGDFAARDRFLARVFTHARLRQVRSPAGLVRFHAAHEPFLLARNRAATTALARLVADVGGNPLERTLSLYAEGLARALSRPARASSRIEGFEPYPAALGEHLRLRA